MSVSRYVVYPACEQTLPAALFFEEYTTNCEVRAFVAPRALAYASSDWGILDNREKIGLLITDEEEMPACLERNDALMVLPYFEENAYVAARSREHILDALQKGKNVLCALPLSHDTAEEYRHAAAVHGCRFMYVRQQYDDFAQEHLGKINEAHTSRVKAYVIYVGSIMDELNNFELMLSLRLHLSQAGYKVSGITANGYGEIFGMHSILDCFSKPTKTDKDWCGVLLQDYAETVDRVEMPDILLVQVPGLLARFSETTYSSFGLDAFLYAQAIPPDYIICNTPFEYLRPEVLPELSMVIENKLGIAIGAVHCSNRLFNSVASFEARSIVASNVSKQIAETAMAAYSGSPGALPVFDLTNRGSMRKFITSVFT